MPRFLTPPRRTATPPPPDTRPMAPKTPLQLLDALAGVTPARSQSPSLPLSQSPRHGGKRTPRPGKKLGRPPKKAKDKAVTVAIVLSSPKAAKALKSRAKRAHLTPGAYIEKELDLNRSMADRKRDQIKKLKEKFAAAQGEFDFIKAKAILTKINRLERSLYHP